MNIILVILPLREWQRDPSMVSGSRGQSDTPKFRERKYCPRSDSSLNFSSELPIVTENGTNEVGKMILFFSSKKHQIFLQKNITMLLKVRTPKQSEVGGGKCTSPPHSTISAIFMSSCSIDLKIELLIDQDHSYRNPGCFWHPTIFSVPLAHILSVGDLFGYIFG